MALLLHRYSPTHGTRLKAVLLVLCSITLSALYLFVSASPKAPPPAENPLPQVYASTSHENPLELTLGTSVTKEIVAGSSLSYAVRLNPGQYLQVLIVKGDLHLQLTCFGPGGDRLAAFVSHRYETLEGSLVAELAGSYRLEVQSLEKADQRRPFELRIERINKATNRDRRAAVALRSFSEAEKLRAKGREASSLEAILTYEKALGDWRSTCDRRGEIRALDALGDLHFSLGQYAKAMDFYQEALAVSKQIGERRRESEALVDVARIYEYLGETEKAKRYCEQVIDSYRKLKRWRLDRDDRRVYAKALNNIGEVYYTLGQPRRALESFDLSAAQSVDVGDRRGEAQARLNLGYALSDSGYQEKALEQYHLASSLFHSISDERGEALALTAFGGIYSFLGQKQSALDSHKTALALFTKVGDKQSEAVALNGIGQAYEDLNENQAALDNYKRALKRYQDNGSKSFAAVTECYVARVYRSMGDNTRSLEHYQNCTSLSRETNKRRIEAYALRGMTEIYYGMGQKAEALRRYREILRLYLSIADRRGQALVLKNLGEVYSASGNALKSLFYYRRALPLIRAVADRNEEAAILYNMAEAMSDLGDLDGARSQIENSIQIIESLRAYVASRPLRSSYFASVYKHYEFYVDLLMRLDERRPGKGFAEEALRASESGRARSLLETLMEVNDNVRNAATPELLDRERSLQQLLSAKANYQIRLLSHNQNNRVEAAEVEQEIQQLATEYDEIEGRISQRCPRFASLTRPQSLSIQEIQAELLDDNTLLLEYSLGEKRSYLWAITRDHFSSYALPPRAELETAAREVYARLTARQPLSSKEMLSDYQARVSTADLQYAEKSSALSRILLKPVEAHLGTKRLLIVSEGILQYIPFEALPDPTRVGVPYIGKALAIVAEPVPLFLKHEIVSLPSISTLAAIRRERALSHTASKAVAVLADPVFEMNDPRLRAYTGSHSADNSTNTQMVEVRQALRGFDFGSEGESGIPRLLYTQREANAIKNVAPSEGTMIATGFDANRARVVGHDLKNYKVVHFATHSFINGEHPELSGIVLSMVNADGAPVDGFLQLRDIYNLDLSAELVVLSSCRTGLGKDIKGEGLVGLTRGFIYAGSKSVVASLWKVDDKATAELMGRFYRALLQEGRRPAAALREAKLEMWEQKRWRAPFYWAAFVLHGEYENKITVKAVDPKQRASFMLAVMALVAILVGSYVVGRVTARRGHKRSADTL